MLELEQRLPAIQSFAANIFERNGFHVPIYMMNIGGDIQVTHCAWSNAADKDRTAREIKELIRSGDLKEYVFIAESWVVSASEPGAVRDAKGFLRDNGSLENHPGRTEALILMYSSPTKEISFKSDIRRDGESVSLRGWEDMGKMGGRSNSVTEGRMQNLFEIAKAETN